MSQLDEVGERDGWRCWVCDEPVDPTASVNDARGPSVDSRSVKAGTKKVTDFAGAERLAHRSCNTRKAAVTAVIARSPARADAEAAAAWLVDRFARLAPGLSVTAGVDAGGGQYLVALTAARRR